MTGFLVVVLVLTLVQLWRARREYLASGERGGAPPRVAPPGIGPTPARSREIPEGRPGCGCCGRELNELFADRLWCPDCELHVGTDGQPHERMYSSIHPGEECPFADDDGDSTAIEGLGPRIPARRHSPLVPLTALNPIDRAAFSEAIHHG